MNIGIRIRKIRRLQNRTLQEIADRADVTKSLLSKIENGKSNPPVATLTRIAEALGVKVASLLADSEERKAVFIPAGNVIRKNMAVTDKGYHFFSFASQRTEKEMQVFMFDAEKGKVKRQPLNHKGEEFVYILEGETEYTVGGVTYTMKEGDSIYFDAEDDHDLNPLSKKVRYLAVFVER